MLLVIEISSTLSGNPTKGPWLSDSQLFIDQLLFFPGAAGRFTNEAGFMSYYEICEFLREDNTTLVWDNEQMVPFAYRDDQWVGFDDERSLKTKVSTPLRTIKKNPKSSNINEVPVLISPSTNKKESIYIEWKDKSGPGEKVL